MNNPKKLTKSRTNRVISGVAGGLGEYLNVDPLVFRILFVVLTFAGGFGAIAYLILLIMMPEDYSFLFENGNNAKSNHSTVTDAEYEVVNDSNCERPRAEERSTEEQCRADFSDLISSKSQIGKVVSFSIGFLFILMGAFILCSKILRFSWWEFIFPLVLLATGAAILILSIHSKKIKS